MPFVQVLLLVTLLAYLLLVALENPGLVKLPLPFGQGEVLLNTGWTVALFAVLGGAYVLLLLLPLVGRLAWQQRTGKRERHALERRLAETLGARVAVQGATAPVPTSPPRTPPVPAAPVPAPAEGEGA